MICKKPSFFLAGLLAVLVTGLQAQNVFIIAVDTLRADHLGCYGYPRETSPNVDAFSRDGILYENCYTPSPLTTPAFAAMLTSLSPHKHGAKRNGLSIFDRVVTLPMLLQAQGYATGAFVTNWTLKKKLTHLDRGFDIYDDVFTKKRWYGLFNIEGEADKVNDKAIKWLYQNREEKIFLWVHYTEPHEPYVYHQEFDKGYDKVESGYYPPGSSHKRIRRYDTEVGFVDFHIGRLIEKIKEYGLYDDALIFFLADHGESLGEHKYYGHGQRLYNPGVHVPLIVKLPGYEGKNTRIDRVVSLLDVSPTILSVLDFPLLEEMEGEDLFASEHPARTLYFEGYKGAVHIVKSQKFRLKVEPNRYGLLKDGFKLIYDDGYEAYDLEGDPFELKNIYKNPDSTFGPLTNLLNTFMNDVLDFIEYSKKFHKQKDQLSAEELERLRSLGYIK
jgi:arylsulfatase A-like enzyme